MPARTEVETRRPFTVRIARWSANHPWRSIGCWFAFVVICLAVGQASGLRQVTNLDTVVGQSGAAAKLLHDARLADPASENVLISQRSGRLDPRLADRAAGALTARLRGLPQVASVSSPVPSDDGQSLLLPMIISGDPDTAADRVQPLLRATAAVQHDYPALRVEQAGGASVSSAVNDQVGRDLSSAARISLPVTLLILLVAFGAILAAGVPVLLALSAVAAASGLSMLASHLVPDSGSTSSMILLMGMAVGVDYSLFYVKRVREECAAGRDRHSRDRHRGRDFRPLGGGLRTGGRGVDGRALPCP